jgi:predicted membrane protein
MEQNEKDMERRINESRIGGGVFLLLIGSLLLAYKMGAPFPSWMFTWPVLLLAIGLFIGIKSHFHNPGSFILILIGGVFLVDQLAPGFNLQNFILPIILIGLGILFILRPRKHLYVGNRSRHWERRFERRRERAFNRSNRWEGPQFGEDEPASPSQNRNRSFDKEEYLEVHAILSGVKKNVQSKDFKGGEIVCFMGGAEINFMQADILHPIVLEVNTVFGGTKLIIPGNWEVQTEISPVFGGVEDKRSFQNQNPDTDKKIILKGSCLFGGVEINNY